MSASTAPQMAVGKNVTQTCVTPSRRVTIIGVSGSGKTTLAKRLAAHLGATHVELDAIAHRAGWKEASADEMRAQVAGILASRDAWVIDGAYESRIGDLAFVASDVVVWLDLPLRIVLPRLVARALADIVTRRDLYNGNRQTFRAAFLERDSLVAYAIEQHFRHRREWPAFFASRPEVRLVRLRTTSDVDGWLRAQG